MGRTSTWHSQVCLQANKVYSGVIEWESGMGMSERVVDNEAIE